MSREIRRFDVSLWVFFSISRHHMMAQFRVFGSFKSILLRHLSLRNERCLCMEGITWFLLSLPKAAKAATSKASRTVRAPILALVSTYVSAPIRLEMAKA